MDLKSIGDIDMNELEVVAESEIDVVADLRNIIGVESAAKLIRICGGFHVYVPKMKTITKSRRDKSIYNEFTNGISIKHLARKYSLSDNMIRKIIKAERDLRRDKKKKT